MSANPVAIVQLTPTESTVSPPIKHNAQRGLALAKVQ